MEQSSHEKKTTLQQNSHVLCAGPFTIDLQEHRANLNGKTLLLPPCTYEYLVTLVRNSPHPVSYQDLVLESQGYHLGKLEAQDLARCRIHLLRKAVESKPDTPQYILAVAGYGYRLVM
jgi:DNA-binding response OmpR family regulator